MTVWLRMCNAAARCRNPGRWRHRPAGCGSGSEVRSNPLAGCVGDSGPLGGVMLTGSAAGFSPLDRSLVVGSQTNLLLSGSSPTILFHYVDEKLLLVVPELPITFCCARAGCPCLISQDRLAFLGVSSHLVPFVVAAGSLFLVLQLTSPSGYIFFLTKVLNELFSAIQAKPNQSVNWGKETCAKRKSTTPVCR